MIEVKELSYTYPKSDRPALHEINFAIQSCEIFGFLGPSGAGKSTTQKILIGLLDGFQGSVTVMDRSVTDWGSDYYERIGVAFEQPNHFLKLTALENLRYFAALYSHQTLNPVDLLRSVGLEEDGNLLVGQYSKGMKNRLTVARALLNDPDLLFLDEPTSGLDPVNARKIKELIEIQKAAGKTVFLTTHNMAVADELCDRVAFIVDGQIRLIDTPHALKLQHGERLVRVEYRNGQGLETRDFNLEGLSSDSAFLNLLRDHPIETIHTQEATLEDIFIQVTGRRSIMNAAPTWRVLSSLRWEVALQFRNGFYYAVGFILVFWVILYSQIPHVDLRAILPGLLLGNLLVTTFYFMAGLVMLEKGEGSLEARVVTPLRSGEYLLVKVLALSLLVLAENLVIAALFSGFSFALLPVTLGLLLSGAIFTLTGFLAVVRYHSINEFLLPSMPYTLLLMLPLADFFGVIQSPLFYLHPVQAALVLMEGGFRLLNGWEWAYGLLYGLAGVVALFVLCRRAFRQFVTVS